MMQAFEFAGLPSRVLFGDGSLKKLPAVLQDLGVQKLFCISSQGQAALAKQVCNSALPGTPIVFCTLAKQHVPSEVVDQALLELQTSPCNVLLAVGGGSSIGLAKAIALKTGLPILAVPTTYSGSEMTPIYGLTFEGKKQTGRAAVVQPKVVAYEPALSLGLPKHIAAASAMNALAHAVEALYASNKNPVISMMAQESVSALAGALQQMAQQTSLQADTHAQALYGAWLAGSCLGAVSMGLHHKVCHVLGGRFNTPHAETHTVMLPYVAHFNRLADPDAARQLQAALGANSVHHIGPALQNLALQNGLAIRLSALGLTHDDIELAAGDIASSAYANPRPVNHDDALLLLNSALEGLPLNPGDFAL